MYASGNGNLYTLSRFVKHRFVALDKLTIDTWLHPGNNQLLTSRLPFNTLLLKVYMIQPTLL